MSDYRVTVKRWDRGWELHIDGLGVTQARSLGEADAMVRDYIEIFDGAEAAADAHLIYGYSVAAVTKFERARKAALEAEKSSARAAVESRRAVAELVAQGVSGADMSRLLGVSPQRVSQLAAAASVTAAAKNQHARRAAKSASTRSRAAKAKTTALPQASKSKSAGPRAATRTKNKVNG